MHRLIACFCLLLSFLPLSAFGGDRRACDSMSGCACDQCILEEPARPGTPDRLEALPSMLGDGFFRSAGPVSGQRNLDRLMVFANDLDAPNPLPAGGSTMTTTEAGPIGIFEIPLQSIQEIQQLLRAAQPLPAGTLVGLLPDAATVTTAESIAAIQTQLAGTVDAYDIIAVVPPPAGYESGVDALFVTRNGSIGRIVFDSDGSGAFLQAGDDSLDAGDDLDAFYFYDYVLDFNVDSPFATAVRAGTVKLANGGTPLPQNRLYFDYGLYTDVALTPGGATVNRFVPGIERAFADGLFSLELRAPFAATVSNEVGASATGFAFDREVTFGNVTGFLKVLLHRTESRAISAGLALMLPTGPTIRIGDPNAPLVQVDNEAVHLGPFVSWMHAPNDRWFTQGFLQFDFAANGNDVLFDTDGNGLTSAGSLNDASYVFADFGLGYWLAQPGRYARPTALIAELHYTGSLSDSDTVRSGSFQVGGSENDIDVLNLTAGLSTQLNARTNLSAGYIAPLTSNAETPGGGAQIRLEYRP